MRRSYHTNKPLDKLLQEFLSYGNCKLLLACRFSQRFHPEEKTRVFPIDFHLHGGISENPVYMPVGFMMERMYWHHLGGLDRNFIALYWDLDLCFRVVEGGGLTKLSSVIVTEHIYDGQSTAVVEPFSDLDISTVSQGEVGRW